MAKLDFYFDYACPWCYMASYTVRELSAEGVTIDYHVWKMPEAATPPPKPEGYYEAATAKLRELRTELNIPLSNPVQSETIPALIATKAAESLGHAEAYVKAVFHAHWGNKQDISSEELLVQIAEEIGLDGASFQKLLHEEAAKGAYDADLQLAAEQNIDTIPSYLNGGDRLLVHHFEDMPTLDRLRQLANNK
ncbi:DsbA family oxidoreductase [Tumebacillus lipolyticus]|uniref:DsbA family protein n=1 Tax=Tumebacillus lipolyticus TaxID=1280370 RepID=A0ABW5A005_9BACL